MAQSQTMAKYPKRYRKPPTKHCIKNPQRKAQPLSLPTADRPQNTPHAHAPTNTLGTKRYTRTDIIDFSSKPDQWLMKNCV